MRTTRDLLLNSFNLNEKIISFVENSEEEILQEFQKLNKVKAYNQYKVLKAMQDCRLSDMHFNWNTGYGYNDAGRETLEKVYSKVFNTEDSIVRPTIVNGTHALTLCLTGILRPGDEMISATSSPYDTLEEVIGIKNKNKSSLKDFGVEYKQIDFLSTGEVDIDSLVQNISNKTRMVYIQRSTGYGWRKALTIEKIKEIIDKVKEINENIIIMVDNCYGEFLEADEPTDIGADLMAGSLIKNPGGGLALTGGYIVGKRELINLISYRMTSPGIGKECGLTFGLTRSMFQGLFIAPQVVTEALKGALLCAKVFEKLGYEVCPRYKDERSDIIQAIKFNSPEKVIAFCEGIQSAAPVDSFVIPVPWDMPGYDSQVIMAAGAFVQGSSIELSADAPIKEPYIAYYQGGLTYEHAKFGVLKGLQSMYDKGLLEIHQAD
ncbi:methionine gamma-lyase family protein [Paramaledivibacter caminithermalis]|uniref:Cystathionine beta-lyase family protein involved in aluminum resistance n=1 Tax=Paramaledivibacter caminithermalis (strain DSM 15212 / CIP 107654 / DViRD3) TaxID=1121301 RepID=A0A1M6JKQ0_PARC5|nr:methionine gamma-lyase family protein [Paramaledivibacter caminithermalis]SHJ47254.1 Cystathionine beta-lyase family protein involved in aluminum resistance [Paramaledivibacter caminithermalis DSM 15212]